MLSSSSDRRFTAWLGLQASAIFLLRIKDPHTKSWYYSEIPPLILRIGQPMRVVCYAISNDEIQAITAFIVANTCGMAIYKRHCGKTKFRYKCTSPELQRLNISQSASHSHQLPHIMSHEPLLHKADCLLHGPVSGVSLACAFQVRFHNLRSGDTELKCDLLAYRHIDRRTLSPPTIRRLHK